jgi:hypothetical protein
MVDGSWSMVFQSSPAARTRTACCTAWSNSTGGIRTHNQSRRFELRRFTKVCVPCQIAAGCCLAKAPPTGFEPVASTVTGWRALQTAPRRRFALDPTLGGLRRHCSSPGGIRTHSIPVSETRWSAGCLPSCVLYLLSTIDKLVPDGIEPPFPGCKPGVVGHWTTGPIHSIAERARPQGFEP